jgi:hypothetical protein
MYVMNEVVLYGCFNLCCISVTHNGMANIKILPHSFFSDLQTTFGIHFDVYSAYACCIPRQLNYA